MKKVFYAAVIVAALVAGLSQVNASPVAQTSHYYGGAEASLMQPIPLQVIDQGGINISRPESAYSCNASSGAC